MTTPQTEGLRLDAALNLIESQQATINELVAMLERDAARFDHCAGLIESSLNISGTLRIERAQKAAAFAYEVRALLSKLKEQS